MVIGMYDLISRVGDPPRGDLGDLNRVGCVTGVWSAGVLHREAVDGDVDGYEVVTGHLPGHLEVWLTADIAFYRHSSTCGHSEEAAA